MIETALSVSQIRKAFGDFIAVNDLSFDVVPGKIYGLLGPNGAGKTTVIRMIMGIILPDAGDIRIYGKSNTLDVLDRTGYLPEERGLYQKMKIRDLLRFFGELKGMKKSENNQTFSYWLDHFGLKDWQDKKVEDLSRGMQQKLQMIITIMHEPELIILDEPFTGLDPVNTTLLKDTILSLRGNGATIIFSTHLMDQVQKLCDSICLINHGQCVLDGELHTIKSKYGQNRIQLQYSGNGDFLKTSDLIDQYDDYGNYTEIRLKQDVDPQELLRQVMAKTDVYRFEIVEPSLNEIFIETVKAENPVGAQP